MESPDHAACRTRTPDEEVAVVEAEWRRIGWPAQQEARRRDAEYNADYEAFKIQHSMCTIGSHDGCLDVEGAAW
jgi:hypothetical protein